MSRPRTCRHRPCRPAGRRAPSAAQPSVSSASGVNVAWRAMRRAVPAVAAGLLLAGPTVLAFRSGGYYAEPRVIAGIVAWLLVLALALAGPAPRPRGRAGRVALAGLVALTAWTALSIAWAPLRGPAQESAQRLVLYTGALVVAVGALPVALRAVE